MSSYILKENQASSCNSYTFGGAKFDLQETDNQKYEIKFCNTFKLFFRNLEFLYHVTFWTFYVTRIKTHGLPVAKAILAIERRKLQFNLILVFLRTLNRYLWNKFVLRSTSISPFLTFYVI